MDTTITPVEQAKICLKEGNNFVFQGGAGSGKTESLKELLQYISLNLPQKKVVCITHTNLAVEEIKSRVGDTYLVSTIHSFLHNIIKNYKKNIKSVIGELFTIPNVIREEIKADETEAEYKTKEHSKYKKKHEKYEAKLYSIYEEQCQKVTGKREYDKNPQYYNNYLNIEIDQLNQKILDIVNEADYAKIIYNKSKFNSFRDMTYGHDGLLELTNLLFEKYPVLKRIISDKYDYVFIDEYQDTRANIIKNLLEIADQTDQFNVCLFGDTMQAIYPDGVGNVDDYISRGNLLYIPKPDNFRCSQEVLDLINTLRLDGIKQEVALKRKPSGDFETRDERHGKVEILYGICDKKPTSFDSQQTKDAYSEDIDKLINIAESKLQENKVLLLTNKAIAKKVGFENLYRIFDERYVEVGERMDYYLMMIQITHLCELCYNYAEKKYNNLIKTIKQSGFVIKKLADKKDLIDSINKFFDDNISLKKALELAFELKILKKSASYVLCIERNNQFLEDAQNNRKYQEFKAHYINGANTFNRIKDIMTYLSEEEFGELKGTFVKENFINQMFDDKLKFTQAINYFNYASEKTKYITMHKTKGSSIDSIIVVIDEYFWNSEYNFKLLYFDDPKKSAVKEKSQKLIYVACSRARKDLICIKMLTQDEESSFCKRFPMAQKIYI
ncbi:MAG TPA: UvrD-helicase domain-containing protein [Candidatus Paceibacterota bacterium]